MFAIMARRQLRLNLHHLHGHHLQTFLLQAPDYFTDKFTLYTVGFDHDKSTLFNVDMIPSFEAFRFASTFYPDHYPVVSKLSSSIIAVAASRRLRISLGRLNMPR